MTDDEYKAAHDAVNPAGDALSKHIKMMARVRKEHKGSVPPDILAAHTLELDSLRAASKAKQDVYVAEVLRRRDAGLLPKIKP